MHNDILTVLIITYNHKDYIERAIKSVLEQETNFDFKVIISDDCSTDGTSDIVRKYAQIDKRIIPLIREKNLGIRESIKSALKVIDTKYFCIFDGDDYWTDKTKLQQQVDLLEKNPDCTVCSHETVVVNSLDNTEELQVQCTFPNQLDKEIYKWSIRNTPYTHISSRVYRNVIPKDNEKIMNFVAYDIYMYYWALDKGDNIFINKQMSVYNYNGKGVYSSLEKKEKKYEEAIALVNLDYMLDYKYSDIFIRKLNQSLYDRIFKLQTHIKNRRIILECKKEKQ